MSINYVECGESSSLRGGGGPVRPADAARLQVGENRRGDTGTDGVLLIQNGVGGGGPKRTEKGRDASLCGRPLNVPQVAKYVLFKTAL